MEIRDPRHQQNYERTINCLNGTIALKKKSQCIHSIVRFISSFVRYGYDINSTIDKPLKNKTLWLMNYDRSVVDERRTLLRWGITNSAWRGGAKGLEEPNGALIEPWRCAGGRLAGLASTLGARATFDPTLQAHRKQNSVTIRAK